MEDAAFLLIVGSFLLAAELLYLQSTILAFCLQLELFFLQALAFLLTVGASLLTVGKLRGPIAILFISRDTCSDSIAKLLRACFCGVSHKYRAICCKMGYRTDVSV